MPELLFPLDSAKKFTDQAIVGHNRWHPDIPAAVTVKPGDAFRVHCREWFDGAIHNDDSADDILNAPLTTVHTLSGPFAVEGAKPGDLLIVDILDIGPIPQEDSGPLAGQGWGYTGIFPRNNGGGFLTEQFPDAYKAVWDFSGQTATSRHIPHVSFTGIVHPGLMGTAPSAALLAKWNAREGALIATDPNRVPPLALPPEPRDAVLGTLTGDEYTRVAGEAARTAPPRENGGNQDIKNLTKGSRIFYPVFVDGANLSVGDLHFSQATVRSLSAVPSRWAASSIFVWTSSRAEWIPTAFPRTPSSCRATRIRSIPSGLRSRALPSRWTANRSTWIHICPTSVRACMRSSI